MDEIIRALAEIEKHIRPMLATADDDRILLYRRIDPHFLSLEKRIEGNANAFAQRKLDELKYHVGILARLDEADEYTDEEHCEGAQAAIGDLRGARGFGLDG